MITIRLLIAATLTSLVFSCNSKADRDALKEEVKAELKAEQTAQENEQLQKELKNAQADVARAKEAALKAKADAQTAKNKAAKAQRTMATNVTPINLMHVKIANLSGYTNLRNSPNGAVCMRLFANTDYDIYVNGMSNGWYRIVEIYRPDGSQVRLHSSNTGWWIHRSICYNAN